MWMGEQSNEAGETVHQVKKAATESHETPDAAGSVELGGAVKKPADDLAVQEPEDEMLIEEEEAVELESLIDMFRDFWNSSISMITDNHRQLCSCVSMTSVHYPFCLLSYLSTLLLIVCLIYAFYLSVGRLFHILCDE